MRWAKFSYKDVFYKCEEVQAGKWRVSESKDNEKFYVIASIHTKLDPSNIRFAVLIINRIYKKGTRASLGFWLDAMRDAQTTEVPSEAQIKKADDGKDDGGKEGRALFKKSMKQLNELIEAATTIDH